MGNQERPPLSGRSYTLVPLDVTEESFGTQHRKNITLELFEGHWPDDEVLKDIYKEDGYYSFVTTLSGKMKIVTKVRKKI